MRIVGGFSEMLVIITPPVVFFLRDMFHTRTSKVSLGCARLLHSLSVASPRFLKGFCRCSFIFCFTFSSSLSHSQKKYDFIHCFIGVYYKSITRVSAVGPFLLFLLPSLLSSSRPSPSAERWMDGAKWLMNQWMILYVCVWQRAGEREIKQVKVCVCV